MLLANLMKEDLIIMDLHSREKMLVIREMIDRLKQAGEIANWIDCLKVIAEREQLKTTGIGEGIAIPHARTNAVKNLVIAFARSREGIDFKSVDGRPVHLIFMLASPPQEVGRYLNALARICALARRKGFRESLIKADNAQEIISLIRESEITGGRGNAKTG